jgi:hypothetical protein
MGGTTPGIAAEARNARQRYPSLCTVASPLDRLADTQKKVFQVFSIAAVLHQQTPHPAASRQSDDWNGIVCDRIPSESAQKLLDHHIGLMAERDRGGNHCAHAGSGDEVDRNSRLGKGLYHADMSKRTRAAARQDEADRLPEDKPGHPRQIALIAAPDVNDPLAREVLQPTRAARRQHALRIVDQDQIGGSMEFGGTVDRPFAGANRARLCIGGRDFPAWARHCIRQSDRVIFAADAPSRRRPAGRER